MTILNIGPRRWLFDLVQSLDGCQLFKGEFPRWAEIDAIDMNGQRGNDIYHGACAGPVCPVKAIAARVSASMPPTTPFKYVELGVYV
jgi:hypothetical protein